jgi:hypothetical protein
MSNARSHDRSANGAHQRERTSVPPVPPMDGDWRPESSSAGAEGSSGTGRRTGAWAWAREQRRIRRRERLERLRRLRSRARARAVRRAEEAGRRARAAAGRARIRAAAFTASARDHLEELASHAQTLLRVRGDRQRLALRRTVRKSFAMALLAIVGITVVVSASLRLVSGIAGGFSELFGNREWAGNLVAALAILGGSGLAWVLFNQRRDREEFQKRMVEYDQRHSERARRPRGAARSSHGNGADPEATEEPGGAPGPRGGRGLAGNPP